MGYFVYQLLLLMAVVSSDMLSDLSDTSVWKYTPCEQQMWSRSGTELCEGTLFMFPLTCSWIPHEADPTPTVARPLCVCVSRGINLKNFQSISRHEQTGKHSFAATLNCACLHCRKSESWDRCEFPLTDVVITSSNPGNLNSKSSFWIWLEHNHCRVFGMLNLS